MAVTNTITSKKHKLEVTYFGLEANTTRGLIISWSFSAASQVEHYKVVWERRVHLDSTTASGQNTVFMEAERNDVTKTSASFHAEQSDTGIYVTIYPIAKTDTNGVKYWSDHYYSISRQINFTDVNRPPVPSVPSVTIEDDKLVVSLYDLDTSKMASVDFEIVREASNGDTGDSIYEIVDDPNVPILKDTITYKKLNVAAGTTYKVRCRAWGTGNNKDLSSEWTDYSEPISSRPEVPIITSLNAYKNKSVRIEFESATKADSYNIEWISEADVRTINYEVNANMSNLTPLFDHSNISKGSVSVNHKDIASTDTDEQKQEKLVYYLTASNSNLQQGGKYYIRIKAVTTKSDDPSQGSEIKPKSLKYFVMGTEPKAPTTWSSVSTAIIGEIDDYINLYWSHNSEDQSIMTESILELTIDGDSIEYWIDEEATEDEYISVEKYDYEKNSTRVCKLKTDMLSIGYDVKWRVKTAGAAVDEHGDPIYGEWSIERTINAYSRPTLIMRLCGAADVDLPLSNILYNGSNAHTMSSFPLTIIVETDASANQTVISYNINIFPLVASPYQTVDMAGNVLTVDSNTKVYSKYLLTNEDVEFFDVNPGDVNLFNGTTYQVTGSVTMSSGITVSVDKYFIINWAEDFYTPGAQIGIDHVTLDAIINPYTDLEDDQKESDVIFSVFRREYDGKYTEIESNIRGNGTWVIDPHPSLNYARYRIVARSKTTGTMSFYDTEPIAVGERGVVIQWDEPWQSYEGSASAVNTTYLETPQKTSMLKLYYNITKSFSNNVDVSFVNYIGREHPVSYYGTHKGEQMTWSVEIDKTDKETLYAIRRLSVWAGDVYVREPSGVGYWANIKVSYNESYNSLVIPISFDITRVEGGK